MTWKDELAKYRAKGNLCLNVNCRKTSSEGVEFCSDCGHSTTTHLELIMELMKDEIRRKEKEMQPNSEEEEKDKDPSLMVINATKDDAWSIPPDTDHMREKGRLLISYKESFLSLFYGHFWAWKEEDPDSTDPTYGPVELDADDDTPGEVEFPDDHPFEDWFVDEVLRVVWGVC